MLLNLSTLRSELKQKIKNNTVTNARVDRWLNLAQDDVATDMDPDHLIFVDTFTATANQNLYYLDVEFNKILSIYNTTQSVNLYQISEVEIEMVDPDSSDTGTPLYFSTYGYSWVSAQPLSASTIDIVSDNVADTTQKVRINGIVSSVQDTELLTLNGTTTVTGTKSFSKIDSISKDSTTTGKITVNVNDASNTVIATFGPQQLVRSYQPLRMFPTPSAADTYKYRAIKKPRPMVNTEDYPDFPESYHEIILLGAAIRGHRDLMRPDLAIDVLENEYLPARTKLIRQMGNKRRKTSPVIIGGLHTQPSTTDYQYRSINT